MLANASTSLVLRRVPVSSQRDSVWSLAFFLARLAVSLVGPVSSFAAELHFRNGDRLTGELVRREDGKITFRSSVLGEIIVAEVDAAVVETAETPVESLAGLPPVPKQAPKPAATPPASTAEKVATTPPPDAK